MRTITISAFRMQKTEVTVGQWRQVMAEDPLTGWEDCQTDLCPIPYVTWDRAHVFLARLNGMFGGGYRLPTEAEWEYAARAGTTGNFNNVAGQAIEAIGWFLPHSQGAIWPVAQKLPNAFGLYDTHGNVWEWVQDRYDRGYYVTSPATNPTGPTTGLERVMRGGWAYGPAIDARSARRRGALPSIDAAGFRVVRVP